MRGSTSSILAPQSVKRIVVLESSASSSSALVSSLPALLLKLCLSPQLMTTATMSTLVLASRLAISAMGMGSTLTREISPVSSTG